MEPIRILCYGDSNTWGYISGSNHLRYGNNERWTRLLSKKLGDNFEIIEEGLNSRTLISNDTRPGKEGKNGYEYLIPCLDTHDPIDLVIVMLGTNELKKAYNKTIEEIGEIFDKYIVKTILNRKSQISNKYPKLLIVAPPLADDDGSGKYEGAYEKSLKFNEIYEKIANDNKCLFIDNNGLETGIDKIHLTKESHSLLAEKIYSKICKEIFLKLKKEKSCGCIIINDNKVLLVYEKNRNFWGFPKGHMENYETEIETALREVKEEVGLEVEINEEKRYTLNYIIRDEIDKTTVLYIAKAKNKEIVMQESEIENAKWCSFDEALNLLTFDNWKEIFRNVIDDINQK